MWQRDAVSEFMCVSHYLAVKPRDAVLVETHKLLTLAHHESPVTQWLEHATSDHGGYRVQIPSETRIFSEFSLHSTNVCNC